MGKGFVKQRSFKSGVKGRGSDRWLTETEKYKKGTKNKHIINNHIIKL